MYHPSETELERYLNNTRSLEVAQRNYIEEHIRNCEECATLLEWLRDINDLVQQQYESFSSHLTHPAGKLEKKKPVRIPLYPYTVGKPEANNEFRPLLLAADHPAGSHGYRSVATMISSEEECLVRILKNENADNYRIFILADDKFYSSKGMLSFPALGKELLADEIGQVTIPSKQLPNETWLNDRCLLHIAVASIKISKDEVDEKGYVRKSLDGNIGGRIQINAMFSEGQIELKWKNALSIEDNISKVALIREDDSFEIQSTDGHRAGFSWNGDSKELEFRFFC